MFQYQWAQVLMNVLVEANSEGQPAALNTSSIDDSNAFRSHSNDIKPVYEISHGFAEGKDHDIEQIPRGYSSKFC